MRERLVLITWNYRHLLDLNSMLGKPTQGNSLPKELTFQASHSRERKSGSSNSFTKGELSQRALLP